MKNNTKLLDVKNLRTAFNVEGKDVTVVNDVSFDLSPGEIVGLVGESGCGKSVTAATIMQLLPTLSRIEEGEIIFRKDDKTVNIEKLEKNGKEMRNIRGSDIAMIFQDPMTALNPVYTVGFQISENLKYHTNLNRKEIREKSISLLNDMGIPLPEKRVDEYPHSYSGGMRQRAMIAMAMACNPKILIADEPTTALDVTIQAQIFELMDNLKKNYNTAIMLITHDMGVVAELADNVAVMYMGNIVESGTADDVLRRPTHPYTKALLDSVPVLGRGRNQDIQPIKGSTPDPYDRPVGCQFAPRCSFADKTCEVMPEITNISSSHDVRCHKYKEIFQY